jgi:mycofactocin system creatininase family protein
VTDRPPLVPLADANWPDVEAATRDVLIVPIGALEQHGPHLPLDTDSYLAAAVAASVHRGRPASGLAPVLPFGSSGEHADFPGTLSIGTDAVAAVVVELVRDACRYWHSVLVVNGHGGNLDALRAAEELCTFEGRRLGVVHLALAGMDAHAGAAETSMMLWLDPGRVRLDLVEPGDSSPAPSLLGRLRDDGVRAVSPNGELGDPRTASAEQGERWMDALTTHAMGAHDAIATTDSAKT